MIRRGPTADLSAVRRDILAILVDKQQADRFVLKSALNSDRRDTVTNASVYNELEQLCDDGLVEKWSGDFSRENPNQYRITRDGLKTIAAHQNWLEAQLDDGPPVCMGVAD